MSNLLSGNTNDLLTVIPTNPLGWVSYSGFPSIEPEYGHNFPIFRRTLVPTMQRDPRIRYGLNLIKGPIQAHTIFKPEEEADDPELHETIREQGIQFAFGIKCKDAKVKEMILDTLNRFWLNGLQQSLLSVDWGYSCCQTIFKKSSMESGGLAKGMLKYDSLKHFHAFDVTPLRRRQDNRLVGAKVRGIVNRPEGVEIPLYKIMWSTHHKEYHDVWGQSRLEWAYVPWHELWTMYGARDIRRTWFFRNSYDGGTMRYPVNKTKGPNGELTENKHLAIQMMAQMRTGGFRVFPNEMNPDQKTFSWDYEPPTANVTPTGLMEYPEQLRYEILEALGIPPEIIESSGGEGHGAATGRKVPLIVYYSTLFPLVNQVINDVRRYIIDLLIMVNFKKAVDYDIYRILATKSTENVPDEQGSLPSQGKPKEKKPTTKKSSPKKTDPVTKVDMDKGMGV